MVGVFLGKVVCDKVSSGESRFQVGRDVDEVNTCTEIFLRKVFIKTCRIYKAEIKNALMH